jgi:hypothetical protein
VARVRMRKDGGRGKAGGCRSAAKTKLWACAPWLQCRVLVAFPPPSTQLRIDGTACCRPPWTPTQLGASFVRRLRPCRPTLSSSATAAAIARASQRC